ncbi:MAG: hypothetical protein IH587_11595, partial [Anaerolineae bacterium]|nr:hypothetical protein [Anaerolineae bacterium]
MKPDSANRLVWLAACLIAAFTFVVYLMTGTVAGGADAPVMPLDDVYIHFQYARQMASGQPYVYNPGLPPTSGATSLIYPFVLASGYLLGFHDLRLGIWAMIVGAVAFAVSIALVYRISRIYAGAAISMLAALAFGLSGAFAWHAMSGMETMLAVCFSLALLYGLTARRLGWLVVGGALLAITRPEGAVGALLASLIILGTTETRRTQREFHPLFSVLSASLWFKLVFAAIPLLAIAAQPLLNLLITGSATAAGSQAKSLFSAALSMQDIIAHIVDNFLHMWREWLLPQDEPVYLNLIITGLAVLGVLRMGSSVGFSSRSQRSASRLLTIVLSPQVLIVLWLIGGALLISTLDTAFWHFKRYQMPFMVLLFPLAAWGAGWIAGKFAGRGAEDGRVETGRATTRPYAIVA